METSFKAPKEAFVRDVSELVALVERPDTDGEKMESFLLVRGLIDGFHPQAKRLLLGLFERGRHEQDVYTMLGRMREPFDEGGLPLTGTREGRRLIVEISHVRGFGVVHKLIDDRLEPEEEKSPIEQRVIREIHITSPTPPGGRVPMNEPNIGGLKD